MLASKLATNSVGSRESRNVGVAVGRASLNKDFRRAVDFNQRARAFVTSLPHGAA